MAQIAEWMKLAIDFRDDEEKLAKIKQEVRDFALKFPLPSDQEN
jgi:glycine/serine hydroxymethyltransferase